MLSHLPYTIEDDFLSPARKPKYFNDLSNFRHGLCSAFHRLTGPMAMLTGVQYEVGFIQDGPVSDGRHHTGTARTFIF